MNTVKKTVKVAGIQTASSQDKEQNLLKAKSLIELASLEGANIIALPQLFNTHWFPAKIDKANFALAEEEGGRTVGFLRELASKHACVIVASIFEKDGDSHYNTAFVLGTDGGIIGKYRKMHVPQLPLWEEKAYFKPGDLGFPVFDTPFAKIGVQLCWDAFFPEGFRALTLKGAQVIIVPTASAFYHSHKAWERAIAASAHANGVFIFRVNRVGKEDKQEFYGRSFCVRPDGEYVGKPSGPSVGVMIEEIDLSEIAITRNDWVFLKDRRPQFYKDLTETKSEGGD